MKFRLILKYEADIDKDCIARLIEEYDEQSLFKIFGVGWETPVTVGYEEV